MSHVSVSVIACIAAALAVTSCSRTPAAVTLAQVNATPCAADSDCAIAPEPCQSGCGHPAVNSASPLYAGYLKHLEATNPCCRPVNDCPRTACAQTMTRPVCVAGRCELRER
jgi:hypothetical protein